MIERRLLGEKDIGNTGNQDISCAAIELLCMYLFLRVALQREHTNIDWWRIVSAGGVCLIIVSIGLLMCAWAIRVWLPSKIPKWSCVFPPNLWPLSGTCEFCVGVSRMQLWQLERSCGHMQLWVTRDIHCFLGYPVAPIGINGFSLVCACVNFWNSPAWYLHGINLVGTQIQMMVSLGSLLDHPSGRHSWLELKSEIWDSDGPSSAGPCLSETHSVTEKVVLVSWPTIPNKSTWKSIQVYRLSNRRAFSSESLRATPHGEPPSYST